MDDGGFDLESPNIYIHGTGSGSPKHRPQTSEEILPDNINILPMRSMLKSSIGTEKGALNDPKTYGRVSPMAMYNSCSTSSSNNSSNNSSDDSDDSNSSDKSTQKMKRTNKCCPTAAIQVREKREKREKREGNYFHIMPQYP